MIHIADTKVERRYGEFFIRQIHKCEDVSRLLSSPKGGKRYGEGEILFNHCNPTPPSFGPL